MTSESSSFGSRRFHWILRHFDVPEKRGHAAEAASLLSAVATSAMAIPTNPIIGSGQIRHFVLLSGTSFIRLSWG
jgi:hypothetical protein